jgi:ABC-2 type transport system ATP-binding protein
MTPAPDDFPPPIYLDRVTKDFVLDWRGRRRRAVEAVSLAIPRGSIGALVGPNGSGKTTLLKICAGLTRPCSGTCRIAGRAPTEAAANGCMGYVADEADFPDYLSAQGLLERWARIGGVVRAESAEAAGRALETVGLAAHAPRRIREFSRGMRQKLALAAALLGDPPVLLLDEPASALDPRALRWLEDFVAAQRAAGRTILLSSHFLPQVEEIADQCLVLADGRVVFAGPRAEVRARGGLNAVYLEAVGA